MKELNEEIERLKKENDILKRERDLLKEMVVEISTGKESPKPIMWLSKS